MSTKEPYPLVSVVIPVYNGINYLGEAVESLFAQTYPNIEILIIDDGSRDSTWNLILSYGEKVRGIHKENGGVSSALNTGIKNARGEFVAWLSHDDIFYPQKIEQQVQFLKDHPEFGAIYTDFEIIDKDGGKIAIYHAPWYPGDALPRQFLQDMHINGSTMIFRRSCLEQMEGFKEHLAHTQDLEMWLRFSRISEIGHLPSVLLKSRSHPEQGSLNFALQIDEEQKLFQELFEKLGPERYFPSLKSYSDPQKVKAAGLLMFADTLARYRRWYAFALRQCSLSYHIEPGVKALLRIWLYKLALLLLGDEHDALMLQKKARISLSLRRPLIARQLSWEMIRKRPFRLDAWAVWGSSWIPEQAYELLRKIKRGLR